MSVPMADFFCLAILARNFMLRNFSGASNRAVKMHELLSRK
jgi:hypothetical protein